MFYSSIISTPSVLTLPGKTISIINVLSETAPRCSIEPPAFLLIASTCQTNVPLSKMLKLSKEKYVFASGCEVKTSRLLFPLCL